MRQDRWMNCKTPFRRQLLVMISITLLRKLKLRVMVLQENRLRVPKIGSEIPTMKHWEINAWYQTENLNYGGLTPREYLSGRSWDLRRAVGLEALSIHKVLTP